MKQQPMKLVKAKAQMAMDTPFYFAMLCRLKWVPSTRVPGFGTDGTHMFYNAANVEKMSVDDIKLFIEQTLHHVVYEHPLRMKGRDAKKFNIAADFAVNWVLHQHGRQLRAVDLFNEDWNESAEGIYERLPDPPSQSEEEQDENREQEQQSQVVVMDAGGSSDDEEEEENDSASSNGGQSDDDENEDENENEDDDEDKDGDENEGEDEDEGSDDDAQDDKQQGGGKGGNGSEQEEDENESADEDYESYNTKQDMSSVIEPEDQEQAAEDIRDNIVQSASMGLDPGNLPAGMIRQIKRMMESRVDWHSALSDFMRKTCASDYSFAHRNRRYTDVYSPALRSDSMLDILVMVDTSGSIDDDQVAYFGSEIRELCNELNFRLTVIYIDTKVQSVQQFMPGEEGELVPKGGGGTRFKPGFDWIVDQEGAEEPRDYSGIIYFTDGQCYDKINCKYPLIWILYGEGRNRQFSQPSGEIVHIEDIEKEMRERNLIQ